MNRHAVVFSLFVLSMITYIDRTCIATSKDSIAAQLHLSDSAMGFIFSAFALGYAVAQIPSGWLADRVGPRFSLAGVVAFWSVLTALTGAAWNLTSLVAFRFLFGMAEAGAFPGSARAISACLAPSERGRAHGVLFSGSRIGAAVSFPLLAWMLARWQWRISFFVLGVIGTIWAAFWILWFREIRATPSVHDAATMRADANFWKTFRSKPVVLAMIQYFAGNFTFFICLSWMLPYLKRQYQLENSRAAAYAMIPLFVGATSQWFAGWLVDRVYSSNFRTWSRRLPGMLGFALAAGGMVAVTGARSPGLAVGCVAMAVFGAEMTISPSWVFCADIAGADMGRVSGAMNMMGNVGSFVSANAFPFLQSLTGGTSAYFLCAAVLNILAMVCWFHMRPEVEPGKRSAIVMDERSSQGRIA